MSICKKIAHQNIIKEICRMGWLGTELTCRIFFIRSRGLHFSVARFAVAYNQGQLIKKGGLHFLSKP